MQFMTIFSRAKTTPRTGMNAVLMNDNPGKTERPSIGVGSSRRELLDHTIALNKPHLWQVIGEYVMYDHQGRIHDAVQKDTPNRRPIENRTCESAAVMASARLGGLHHRYTWPVAA